MPAGPVNWTCTITSSFPVQAKCACFVGITFKVPVSTISPFVLSNFSPMPKPMLPLMTVTTSVYGMSVRRDFVVCGEFDALDDHLSFGRVAHQDGELGTLRKRWVVLPCQFIGLHPGRFMASCANAEPANAIRATEIRSFFMKSSLVEWKKSPRGDCCEHQRSTGQTRFDRHVPSSRPMSTGVRLARIVPYSAPTWPASIFLRQLSPSP